MKTRVIAMTTIFVFVVTISLGCGDDDCGTTPVIEGSGAIVIDQTPNSLAGAGWVLSGPQYITGSGDMTLTDAPVGDYTLTWNDVGGYIALSAETKNLVADSTVAFSGVYSEEPIYGTIVIDQTPNTLPGAGWTLSGPRNETGSGDVTLTDVLVGEYTLTWNAVSGYISPLDQTQVLEEDSTVIFSGTYGSAGVFCQISAGTFTMGSPESEEGRNDDEDLHTVTLTTSFEMFATEVTNQQFVDLVQWAYDHGYCTVSASSSRLRDALDGSNRALFYLSEIDYDCEISFNNGTFTVDSGKESHPVFGVTWYGAVSYCDWLSLQAGLIRAYDHSTWSCNDNDPYSAVGYRLPTEAEWEYACRAGTQTPFNTGDCLDAEAEANYNGIYPYSDCPRGPNVGGTVPVGSYPANAWGLHDMHGNLWEFCNDWYGSYAGDETDPVGPGRRYDRVTRGGGLGRADYCRSAARLNHHPLNRSVGFRPTRSTN